jgi:hypothetical protein
MSKQEEDLRIFKPLGTAAYVEGESSLDREFFETLIRNSAARKRVMEQLKQIKRTAPKLTVVVPYPRFTPREMSSKPTVPSPRFTPESGYYSTGNGDQVFATQGTEPDISACNSECGYCGRC